MGEQDRQLPSERFLASGDEAGTAPEDRPFRPDVEGLRAVAVLLVVLFHSGISALSGGYVGVDVFFVISGFVITGVLLRERSTTGRTSILSFYGRRCRRIIPAATLVVLVTVFLSYHFLGFATGDRTANDARWATLFLANFHFSAIGTNYLTSQQPPSPLQNYWSLAVEEQFYLVYPTLFLLVASIRMRVSFRARLAIGLASVIGASLTFSVIDTHSHATVAYFSPFTRAWELALGALVAVGTPWLKKTVPTSVAAMATWIGFAAILISAFTFTSQTAYPGSLVTLPVGGAAVIIAAGVKAPRRGVEALLGRKPFRWLGKLSYSLYLWHWPILIIAAENAGKASLSLKDNLGWDIVALAASAISYAVLENPVRHARLLFRVRWASVGLGAALVALAFGAITLGSDVEAGSVNDLGSTSATGGDNGHADLQTVVRLVAASSQIKKVPSNLVPALSQLIGRTSPNIGFPPASCFLQFSQSAVPACTFGDITGMHTMVLYGDSHAAMWFEALDEIATRARWKLVVLTKASCPAAPLPTHAPGTFTEWVSCDQWHQFAIDRINRTHADLLVVAQSPSDETPNGTHYPPAQWGRGLQELLRQVKSPTTGLVIGNLSGDDGLDCLAQHVEDVQKCSSVPTPGFTRYVNAERLAATKVGARYVSITPWFCARTCSPIVGKYDVYFLGNHVAVGYSRFLEGVLAESLALPTHGQLSPRH